MQVSQLNERHTSFEQPLSLDGDKDPLLTDFLCFSAPLTGQRGSVGMQRFARSFQFTLCVFKVLLVTNSGFNMLGENAYNSVEHILLQGVNWEQVGTIQIHGFSPSLTLLSTNQGLCPCGYWIYNPYTINPTLPSLALAGVSYMGSLMHRESFSVMRSLYMTSLTLRFFFFLLLYQLTCIKYPLL